MDPNILTIVVCRHRRFVSYKRLVLFFQHWTALPHLTWSHCPPGAVYSRWPNKSARLMKPRNSLLKFKEMRDSKKWGILLQDRLFSKWIIFLLPKLGHWRWRLAQHSSTRFCCQHFGMKARIAYSNFPLLMTCRPKSQLVGLGWTLPETSKTKLYSIHGKTNYPSLLSNRLAANIPPKGGPG